ncbi:MAG: asparagine synthase-related protein, partial [Henriciella sp.]|uniref:asparagine synthase-related protein n=1 Tax=Henriciella sp. TaxID=1968823 RepID=UPI003C775C87
MAAFFAMHWAVADGEASAQAGRILHEARKTVAGSAFLEMDGFALLHLDPTRQDASLHLLKDGDGHPSGAVFGTLFRRCAESSPLPVTAVPPADSQAILQSNGEALLDRFWGRYVFFRPGARRLAIMGDPSSGIPCFYCRQGHLALVFSNLELCPFLDLRRFSLNLHFVRALLAYDKIQTGQTGLDGVYELGLGQRAEIQKDDIRTNQVWDPRQFAEDAYRPRLEEAVEAVRTTIDQAVDSWRASQPNILLNLSGGLDSGAVAASLVQTGGSAAIEAVHFELQSDDPSEFHHARKVADHLGLPLIKVHLSPDDPLPPTGSHPLSARPYREFTGSGQLQRTAALCQGPRAALFSGQGGDQLFQQIRSSLGFADYLKVEGPGSHIGRELLNAARLSERSVFA